MIILLKSLALWSNKRGPGNGAFQSFFFLWAARSLILVVTKAPLTTSDAFALVTLAASHPPICPARSDLTLILSELYHCHDGNPTPMSVDANMANDNDLWWGGLYPSHHEYNNYRMTEQVALISY